MKTATSRLEDDHVAILRLIDVMDHLVETRSDDFILIEEITGIIRNFADGIHHSREEGIFFPFLEKIGFSSRQGPVAVMLNEHAAGRNFVAGITENISLHRKGDKDAIGKVYLNMSSYSELLRAHIAKENNILFRMADRSLSVADQEILAKEFDRAEKNNAASQEFTKRIDELASMVSQSNLSEQ